MLSVHVVSCCISNSPVHAGVLEHVSIGYSSVPTGVDYMVHIWCNRGDIDWLLWRQSSVAVNFRRLFSINDSCCSILVNDQISDGTITIYCIVYQCRIFPDKATQIQCKITTEGYIS